LGHGFVVGKLALLDCAEMPRFLSYVIVGFHYVGVLRYITLTKRNVMGTRDFRYAHGVRVG